MAPCCTPGFSRSRGWTTASRTTLSCGGSLASRSSTTLIFPQLAAQFRGALQRPAVSAALRLATYRQPPAKGDACHVFAGPDVRVPRWELYRERRFSVRDDHGILSGAFDRLVVLYDGDQALGADILDYKTDDVPADDPQAVDVRADIYRPQLDAYRRAASKLCRLAADQVSVRLLFIEPGVMKTL